MGNTNITNIDIDHLFESEIVPDPTPIELIVNNKVKITCNERNINMALFDFGNDSDPDDIKRYYWNPKSHMRDFEVMDPFTPFEKKIARGQGIGTIIVEELSLYIKLYKDKKSPRGIEPVVGLWNHSEEAKSLLAKDLGIGYDVLFISKGQVHHLCEQLDERDEENTVIILSKCQELAEYQE
ncbi:Hypothetical protein ORPV_528 [Orpheovirus IHUMI-LCC2]|uniref:Uncharacterized protein n=1 Tax=Orpheovirus IHUMI-LCC2 TaxID=2023057 RepID=A0A2I2L4F7_9VIRU|nr:Hypothetical protein ORPV_528 [Orpheovirus IHUMI-LCC2]SNW62432.1 Hypothetical protein ORPV_528 [Orpheovirus IHUMI-LCC2]